SPTKVNGGSLVTVTMVNGPGNPTDWVAMYPVGAPDDAPVDWSFLNGTRTAPATGLTSATVSFMMPTTAGIYQARFFPHNTYAVLATSAPITVVTDATPPVVSVTAPASNASVSGAITITATASDNVGVVGVQFQVDGLNLGSEDLTAPYSAPWNTTVLSDGIHTVRAVARDLAGNQTTSAAVSVSVANNLDRTPPVISGVGATAITRSGATI